MPAGGEHHRRARPSPRRFTVIGMDTVHRMQLGFAVPISGSWATPGNCREVAGRAEELGYASLWTFQRLLVPVDPAQGDAPRLDPPYRSVDDPLAVLAFLAGVTSRPRLGVAIVNLPYYSPVVLAKLFTTIDRYSGGRLDAGLGIGWSAEEFVAVGTPIERRGARADDFLRCLEAIWSDDVVDYDGEFYRVPRSRIEPKPFQRPRPPILMGGMTPPALTRIGRVADGWISSSRADLSRIEESITAVRRSAEDAGRDPDGLRFVCRGVVKVRARAGAADRAPLTGTLDEIRDDLAELEGKGLTETFVDLNFDPALGSPDADPDRSMDVARTVIEALAPQPARPPTG